MLSVSYAGKNAYSAGKTSGVFRGSASAANRCYVLAHCGGGGTKCPDPFYIAIFFLVGVVKSSFELRKTRPILHYLFFKPQLALTKYVKSSRISRKCPHCRPVVEQLEAPCRGLLDAMTHI